MNTKYQPCYVADNHTNVAVFVSTNILNFIYKKDDEGIEIIYKWLILRTDFVEMGIAHKWWKKDLSSKL